MAALVACALLSDGKYGLEEDGEEEGGQEHGIGGGGGDGEGEGEGGGGGGAGGGGGGGGGGKGGDDKEGSNAALKMQAPPPVLLHLKRLTLGSNGVEGAGAYAMADYINVLVAWAMYTDLNGGGGEGGRRKPLLPPLAIDLSFNRIGDDSLVEMARACFPGYKDADVEEALLARRGQREPMPAAERSEINLSHNPITQQGPLEMLERHETAVREGTKKWARSVRGGGSIVGVCLKDGERSELDRALARCDPEVAELFEKTIVM